MKLLSHSIKSWVFTLMMCVLWLVIPSITNAQSTWCNISFGQSCSSSSNSCGQNNQWVIQCNGSCSADTPSNNQCPSTPGQCGYYANSCTYWIAINNNNNFSCNESYVWTCSWSNWWASVQCSQFNWICITPPRCWTSANTCTIGTVWDLNWVLSCGQFSEWSCAGVWYNGPTKEYCSAYNGQCPVWPCGQQAGTCNTGVAIRDNNNNSCDNNRARQCYDSSNGSVEKCSITNSVCPTPVCGTEAGTCNSGKVIRDNNSNSCNRSRSRQCYESTNGKLAKCNIVNPICPNASCGAIAGTCAVGIVIRDNNKMSCNTSRLRQCYNGQNWSLLNCAATNPAC